MPNFAPLPFGEWRPDIASLDSQFATEAQNVFPGAASYKPMPSLLAFAAASLANGGNDSNTKVLLHFDGTDASTTITDSNSGGSAHTWTAAGNAQIDTAQSVFGGASLLLDGTGDWVTTNDHADFTLGSADFTIDAWARPAVDGSLLYVAGQADSSLTASLSAWVLRRTSGNKIELLLSNGSAFTTITGATTNLVAGAQYHIEIDRSGSGSNNITIYVNGAVEIQGTFSGTVHDSANNLRVGAGGEITTTPWNGWIDEFRMSSTARHTAAFTVPTVAYFIGGKAIGLFTARKLDGTWRIYGGTATRLFEYNSSASGWVDITRASGVYGVPGDDLWSMDQFGTKLYAVNTTDNMQSVDVEAAIGTLFADSSGSPPKARTVKQIGDFLVLSALVSNPRKIRWSSINDPTGFTVGTNLCDEQEFPDGGPVMGVAGSEIGYVVQDRSIRLMQFLPGDSTLIFTFSRILKERGCISPYGFCTVGNTLYFVAEDGFYALLGQQVFTIGQDKINDWFVANSDVPRRAFAQCISAFKPFVFWAYYVTSGAQNYGGIIGFDWSLQRWSHATIEAQVWGITASIGLDLDTTGTEAGDSLADSSAMSLDSPAYIGGRPLVSAVNSAGYLAAQNGPNLQATIETAEIHPVPGYRAFVSEVEPLCDAGDATITVSTREKLQDAPAWGAAFSLENTGWATVDADARLMRFRLTVPAGVTWTHAQGVSIAPQQSGSV